MASHPPKQALATKTNSDVATSKANYFMTSKFTMGEGMLSKLTSPSRRPRGDIVHTPRSKQITRLPVELYRPIFIHLSDPRDIVSVRAACSLFYMEATSIHYPSLTISNPFPWSVAFVQQFSGFRVAISSLQTLKLRLVTESLDWRDMFRRQVNALRAILLGAHNLVHYEVWGNPTKITEARREVPCPPMAPCKLRVLKIAHLDLPRDMCEFLSRQSGIETLEVRPLPPRCAGDFLPLCESEISKYPDMLPNLKSLYCSSPDSQGFGLADRPKLVSLRVEKLEGSFALSSKTIIHFGVDSLVGSLPDLANSFPTLRVLSIILHQDDGPLTSLPRSNRYRTQVLTRMPISRLPFTNGAAVH